MPLAIDTYDSLRSLEDDEHVLNLAWTLDERHCLSIDLDALIAHELATEIDTGLPYLNRYLVKDPYGEAVLGPSVASFFSIDLLAASVTCGAGVISLLQSLAVLTDAGPAYAIGEIYPDFPHWVERLKVPCLSVPGDLTASEHVTRMTSVRPSLVFLERPSLLGDRFSAVADVVTLCKGAASLGAVVLVDESNATYYPPAFSAVSLVAQVDNLVVLRGFSKAYGLGGLRIAFCVASSPMTERVRAAVPPLLTCSLALRIGARVLEQGDIAGPLRQRIAQHKPEMTALFHQARLVEVRASSAHLPYLVVENTPEYVGRHVQSRGIAGKFHAVWPSQGPARRWLYRLSVPLDAERMERLRVQNWSPTATD